MPFDEEWSDPQPDDYDRSEAISQFHQHLYEQWKRGEGPCRDCSNYEKKKKCYPSFGKGAAEAEIMIVGNSPGPRDRSLEIDNKGRKIGQEKLDRQPEFDGHPLESFYNYGIDNINTWRGISTLRKRFIEGANGLNTDLTSGRFYFTNAKKCTNIEGRDNDEAVARCSQYLDKEIEIVSPSVVITWGMQAADGTARALGYETSMLPNRSTKLPQGDSQPTDSCIGIRQTDDRHPHFITMPHWALLGSNAKHIPGFEAGTHSNPEKQLYYELAHLVQHLTGGRSMASKSSSLD